MTSTRIAFFLMVPKNVCLAARVPSCLHQLVICVVQHSSPAFTIILAVHVYRSDGRHPCCRIQMHPILVHFLFFLHAYSPLYSSFAVLSISLMLFLHTPHFFSFTSFPSSIHLLSIHPSFLPSLLLFLSPLHFPPSPSPIFKHCSRIFLPSYSFSNFLSITHLIFSSDCLPFPTTIYHHRFLFSVRLPLLPPPLPTCRTIRRSTWSTYTAGLTACAPRMKAPTSSSPPLPSI